MQVLEKVLLVEDEPDIQAVAKLALEMLGGLVIQVCSSGSEALEVIDEFQPQLVLLDVMMPGMDGPETLAAIQQHPVWASIPVAFMTAKVQPSEVAHYKSLGALEVIPKPFDPMTLSDQVKAVWQAHSQSASR